MEQSSSKDRTLVLVGKIGCGKSATGNSILRRRAFVSEQGSTLVTRNCQKESIELADRVVTVIDTPGMFAPSVASKDIGKEREKIRHFANDGIHAVILVISLLSRFSEEEDTTLDWLEQFFGKGIVDYVIIVFTGEDHLKKEETLPYHLRELPEPLKNIMGKCKNRYMKFNNNTSEKYKMKVQLDNLLDIVDKHIIKPKGKPYSGIPRNNKVENKLEKLKNDLATAQQKQKDDAKEISRLQGELNDRCCVIL